MRSLDIISALGLVLENLPSVPDDNGPNLGPYTIRSQHSQNHYETQERKNNESESVQQNTIKQLNMGKKKSLEKKTKV